jgi:hypothetical protein
MLIALSILLQAGFVVRVLLRARRDPASRIAWLAPSPQGPGGLKPKA